MPKEKTVVLGISIGTRRVGIAIFKGGELLEWKVSVFKGKWSAQKLAKILRQIERLALRYRVSFVALKVPGLVESSPGLRTLIAELKTQCIKRQLSITTYSIRQLKAFCFPNQRSNKKTLVDYIVQKFPEVSIASKKERTNRNSYYVPMFEAIIVAAILTLERAL